MPRPRASAKPPQPYDVLAIGASWGGVELLQRLVAELPADWQLPIVIVQHQHPNSGRALEHILARSTRLVVRDVEDKDRLEAGHIYIAPANYHLLLEDDGCFSLSLEAPVKYCRPALDVTFSSLAHVLQERCIGLVLTGANADGADGIRTIKAAGGHTLAQSPASAEAATMPEAAIATGAVDRVLEPAQIVPHLLQLLADGTGNAEHSHR